MFQNSIYQIEPMYVTRKVASGDDFYTEITINNNTDRIYKFDDVDLFSDDKDSTSPTSEAKRQMFSSYPPEIIDKHSSVTFKLIRGNRSPLAVCYIDSVAKTDLKLYLNMDGAKAARSGQTARGNNSIYFEYSPCQNGFLCATFNASIKKNNDVDYWYDLTIDVGEIKWSNKLKFTLNGEEFKFARVDGGRVALTVPDEGEILGVYFQVQHPGGLNFLTDEDPRNPEKFKTIHWNNDLLWHDEQLFCKDRGWRVDLIFPPVFTAGKLRYLVDVVYKGVPHSITKHYHFNSDFA